MKKILCHRTNNRERRRRQRQLGLQKTEVQSLQLGECQPPIGMPCDSIYVTFYINVLVYCDCFTLGLNVVNKFSTFIMMIIIDILEWPKQ